MATEIASIEVTLKLLGSERFQTGMRESGTVSEQTGARVKRAMDGIAASTDRVSAASIGLTRTDRTLQAMSASALRAEVSFTGLSRSFGLLQSAVAGLAGGAAANAFRNYADTATNIQNRLSAVIPVQAQRAAIDQQIFDTAQKTRTSYEATANIFSRMSLSSSTIGASQAEILRAVEITQKALQAGGATSSESASIATQLSQALGSGKLAGDELKSIAENSPVLIQAIAREFNVAVGALKDMGANGELTSDRVFRAILNAGKEVDDVFARTTPTISAGIQQIDNALTRYIGNVDKSIGATKALVGGLEFVAKNLDTIGDSAALAVAALAGPLGARLLGGAGSRVSAPFKAAGAEARSGLADANGALAAARAAREAAEAELKQAQRALSAMDEQPRFRQASPDLQRSYERQAAKVDQLREAATKTAEREAQALLKRADTEGVVAQASETASSRAEKARARLEKRESDLQALIARRAQIEAAAAAEPNDQSLARYNLASRMASDQKALIADIDKAVAAASAQGVQSVAEQNRARVYAAFEKANSANKNGFTGPLLKTIYEGLPGMSRADANAAIKSLIADRMLTPSQLSDPKSYARNGIRDEFMDLGGGRIDLLTKGHADRPYAPREAVADQAKIAELTARRAQEVAKLTEIEKEHAAAAKALSSETVSTKTAEAGTLTRLNQQIERQQERVTKAREAETKAIDRETQSRTAAAARQARAEGEAAAAAIAASAQRRSAQQALSEAEKRLGGLAGQVGPSAAAQRVQAIQQVEAAQSVLNRTYFAEQEAAGKAAEASNRAGVAKVALAGTARAVTGAVSGMVAMLGGPLGAALTAASVGLVGYELYQARAAASAEKHTEALGKLSKRMQEIASQTEAGQARTTAERLADTVTNKDALRGVRDRRDRVLDNFQSAQDRAERDTGYLSAQVPGGTTTAVEAAAQRLNINLSQVIRDARSLGSETEGAVRASQNFATVLEEVARIDPRYAERAVEARKLANEQAAAAETARKFVEAQKANDDLAGRTGSRQAVYDGEGLGPLTRAPSVSAEETKAQLAQIEGYAKSVGASFQAIGGQSYSFPELTLMREQLQGAVRDIATVRAQAPAMLSGFSVPPALLDVVQAFSRGQESAEGYAQRLRELREAHPNFAPLIDSLLKANEVALKASDKIDSVGARVDALNGKSAEVSIVVRTTSLASVKVADAKEVEDQTAVAEKAMTDLQAKTYNLQLRAKGETARAKAIELQGSNPGLDLRAATEEIRKQEALEERIAALGRKGRGGGRKSPEQRSTEKLGKKLEELDQDASVAALNDFDQKTVRFAQSAKVASEQIQAFIAAAKSGNLSSVPPVMQEIYDKMRQLEGVKLGKAALDDLFPGRLLAEQIESVRRASQSSPEIAANLGLIEQRLREKNAPEWAKDTTSAFSDMVKSVATGTATMADALSTLKQRIVSLAFDVALKPFERMLTGSLSGGSGGFDLTSIFSAFTGGGGGSPTGGVRLFHSGGEVGVAQGPLRSLPLSTIAKAPRFHTGLGSDEFAAVLQRGERVLTSQQNTQANRVTSALADAASKVQPAGGSYNVQINEAPGGDKHEVRHGTDSRGNPMLIIDAIDRGIARKGPNSATALSARKSLRG